MDTSTSQFLTFDRCVDIIGLILSLGGIIAGAIIAIKVVKSLQSRLTDSRVLKDYFMNEIREIRKEYRTYITDLLKGSIDAQSVVPWFKIMSIRVNDMLESADSLYHIKNNSFSDYHISLLTTITESDSFTKCYKKNCNVSFDRQEKLLILNVQKDFIHVFNEAILLINNANYRGPKEIRKEKRNKKREMKKQLKA